MKDGGELSKDDEYKSIAMGVAITELLMEVRWEVSGAAISIIIGDWLNNNFRGNPALQEHALDSLLAGAAALIAIREKASAPAP
jgi:hypothetical protein